MYLDANNLYGWAMSQKLSVNDFKRKNIFKLNENFIKNYDENSNKENVFEVNVEYLKKHHNLDSDLHFYQKEQNLKKQQACMQFVW